MCQIFKDRSWSFKNCFLIPHAFNVWPESFKRFFIFLKLCFEKLGDLGLKHLRKAPEVKHRTNGIGKFQPWIYRVKGINAQREHLQLSASNSPLFFMELSDWSLHDRLFSGDVCLRIVVFNYTRRETFTNLPPLCDHIRLFFRIHMFMYFRMSFFFFFCKYLVNHDLCLPSLLSVFVLALFYDKWSSDRLAAGCRLVKTSDPYMWDPLYKNKRFREEWQIMNAAFLVCGEHGGNRPGAWLSGPCALSAVPRAETRPYVLAQMSWTQRRLAAFCHGSWESDT